MATLFAEMMPSTQEREVLGNLVQKWAHVLGGNESSENWPFFAQNFQQLAEGCSARRGSGCHEKSKVRAKDPFVAKVVGNKFEVAFDVKNYKPDELKVEVTDEGFLQIHGKHEEDSPENGFISRQFTRRHLLPKGWDPKSLKSSLNSEGILSIGATIAPPEERVIPIHISLESKKVEAGSEEKPLETDDSFEKLE